MQKTLHSYLPISCICSYRLQPPRSKLKLFEDSLYIAFCNCQGEFGGTAFFYNKLTGEIHFTESTCAVAMINENNKYLLLSYLGHMMGNACLLQIEKPDLLSVELRKVKKKFYAEPPEKFLNKEASRTIFHFPLVGLFSLFKYQNRLIYLTYYNSTTFLSEIINDTINIVNPLFCNEIYTHNPITSTYNGITLINLDFYSLGNEREVSGIILKDDFLIKYDWNTTYRYDDL